MEANSILNSAFEGLKLSDDSNAERVAALLDEYNLRWKVSKQDLFLKDGTETQYKAVVREDNNTIFQTCKESYTPFQNSELAELLIKIADKGGYEIHSGGMFNGGGKVFVQLNSGNSITGIGKNKTEVKGYITGINSHDGTSSLKWGSSNITICCKNTFAASSRQLTNRARHTNSMYNKVDTYLKEIDFAIIQETNIFNKFIKLSETPVEQHNIVKIVSKVTGVDIMQSNAEAETNFSKYSINRSEELLTSIHDEMNYKGQTLWGLLSGVTHYTTHKLPVPSRENARLESKYVGMGNKIDNEIFELLTN